MGSGQTTHNHNHHGLLVQSLAKEVHVDKALILKLSKKFADLAEKNSTNHNTITKDQFIEALSFVGADHIISNDAMMQRVFELVDSDHDGHIFFKNFILGLAPFINNETDSKLAFAFKVYDRRGSGELVLQDIIHTISLLDENDENSFNTNNTSMSKDTTKELSESEVKDVFEKYSKKRRGSLNYEEFKYAVAENPALVRFVVAK